jgi:DNA-binding transcriptional LysR family regulator
LPKFMQRHPRLKVQLLLEDRYTDLAADSIDVAIRIGMLKDSTLVATRIASIPRVFCASPAYLEQNGEPESPAELARHNCLHYNLVSTREEWGFLKDDKSNDVAISGSLSTNNGEILKAAAIQDIGITVLPTFIVADALSDGRLKAILSQYNPKPFGLHTVRQSRQFTTAKVRNLIDFLSQEFSDSTHMGLQAAPLSEAITSV